MRPDPFESVHIKLRVLSLVVVVACVCVFVCVCGSQLAILGVDNEDAEIDGRRDLIVLARVYD